VKLSRRNLAAIVCFLLPLFLYWVSGGDLFTRSSTLAFTFYVGIFCGGIAISAPFKYKDEEGN